MNNNLIYKIALTQSFELRLFVGIIQPKKKFERYVQALQQNI